MEIKYVYLLLDIKVGQFRKMVKRWIFDFLFIIEMKFKTFM